MQRRYPFLLRDRDRLLQQISSEALPLELVRHHECYLGSIAGVFAHQSGNSGDGGFSVLVDIFADERKLAIEVQEATWRESLMRGSEAELQRREVAVVDTAFRKMLVKVDHHRLVIRANRSDIELHSIAADEL